MGNTTPEQTRDPDHTIGFDGPTVNGPVTPAIPPLGVKLSRGKALVPNFEKTKIA